MHVKRVQNPIVFLIILSFLASLILFPTPTVSAASCEEERELLVEREKAKIATLTESINQLQAEINTADIRVDSAVATESFTRSAWQNAEQQHALRGRDVIAAVASRIAERIAAAQSAYEAATAILEAARGRHIPAVNERDAAWTMLTSLKREISAFVIQRARSQAIVGSPPLCPGDFPPTSGPPDF